LADLSGWLVKWMVDFMVEGVGWMVESWVDLTETNLAVLMVLMMADSMVELMVLMMVGRKNDEKVPWMAESTVYWMVGW